MCSHFIVGNKIFCFFKKRVFAFLDEGTSQGGSQVLQNFEGLLIKRGREGGGQQIWIFVGGGARQKGVRSILQGGADTLEDTDSLFKTGAIPEI